MVSLILERAVEVVDRRKMPEIIRYRSISLFTHRVSQIKNVCRAFFGLNKGGLVLFLGEPKAGDCRI